MKKFILPCFLLAAIASACTSHYELAGISRSRILIDSTYANPTDAEAEAFLQPYKQKVDSVMSPIVGRVATYMWGQKPESNLSNLLSDILIWAGKDYGEKPEFAVYNMGGIRAALPAGTVTFGNVLDVAPFENKICFFDMTGSAVIELFEQIAANRGEGVSHGVNLVITDDGKLLSAKLNGKEIDPKRTYRVASIDYLAQGNDRLVAFKKKTNLNSPQEEKNNLRNVITLYLRQMMEKGIVVDSKVEGRIVIK